MSSSGARATAGGNGKRKGGENRKLIYIFGTQRVPERTLVIFNDNNAVILVDMICIYLLFSLRVAKDVRSVSLSICFCLAASCSWKFQHANSHYELQQALRKTQHEAKYCLSSKPRRAAKAMHAHAWRSSSDFIVLVSPYNEWLALVGSHAVHVV